MIFVVDSTAISKSDSSTGMQLLFIHLLSFLNLLNMFLLYIPCGKHCGRTYTRYCDKKLCIAFPIFVHLTIGKEIQIWKQISMQSFKFSTRGLIKSVIRR